MKFVFNLQKLMDLREKFMEMAKEELAKKIQERIKVEKMIEEIKIKIDDFEADFNTQLQNSITTSKFQQLIQYREFLDSERKKLIKIYSIKLKEEQLAREDYIEAKKEKDILDKLKERKHEDFMYELKTSEIQEMDEIAQKIYARNSKLDSDKNNDKK